MCAEGILVLIGTNEDLAKDAKLDKHFSYYFVCIALLLWAARSTIVSSQAPKQPVLIMR